MLYFKINDYITLKLEYSRTNIYVKGRLFNQCKYLLLNIPTSQIHEYSDIESIDEAAERLNRSLEGNHVHHSQNITPETEFWGHCSNLQAWAENEYDTRLLHRNLAFPLLKSLVDAGDPQARKVFKEQIALRIVSGHPSVIEFLLQQGYFDYLTKDELQTISEDPQFITALLNNFANLKKRSYPLQFFIEGAPNLLPNLFLYSFSDKKYHYLSNQLLNQIKGLRKAEQQTVISYLIDKLDDGEFYIDIEDIVNIFGLNFIVSCLKPSQLNNLFKYQIFRNSLLRYEDEIIFINDHEYLDLTGKKVKDLRKLEGLENFKTITKVILDHNSLTSINGLEILHNIEELSLQYTNIQTLKGFDRFPSLKKLNLAHNNLTSLFGLTHLESLEELNLSYNKILEIDCRDLPSTEAIHLENNLIMKIGQQKLSKFQIEFKISEYLSANLDDDVISIKINQEPIICVHQDRVYVCENGVYQRQNFTNDSIPGFCEVEYYIEPAQKHSLPKIYINNTYPIKLEDSQIFEYPTQMRFRQLCANLKLWAEHDFDNRLLRHDIAFPLLNKLKRFWKSSKTQIKDLPVTLNRKSILSQPNHNNRRSYRTHSNNTNYKKRFYTHNNELFAIMIQKTDTIHIQILNPLRFKIQETSDDYLNIFLKEALLKIKEQNPQLNVDYNFVRNTLFIENITITHVNVSTHLDLITKKFGELIA
ncbi:MAG: leucine-rich repeat domain-containing protein [Promethearchaeota archaeon]